MAGVTISTETATKLTSTEVCAEGRPPNLQARLCLRAARLQAAATRAGRAAGVITILPAGENSMSTEVCVIELSSQITFKNRFLESAKYECLECEV